MELKRIAIRGIRRQRARESSARVPFPRRFVAGSASHLRAKTELKRSSSGSQSEESGDRELRKAPQKCRFLAVLLPVPFAHGNGTDVFVALLLLHTVVQCPVYMTTYNIITNLVVVLH